MFDYEKTINKRKPTAKDIFNLTALAFVITCKEIFTLDEIYNGLTTKEINRVVNDLRNKYFKHGGDNDTLTHYYNIYAFMFEQLNTVIKELNNINADLFTLSFYQRQLLKDIGTDRENETIEEMQRLYAVNISTIKDNIYKACSHISGFNVFMSVLTGYTGISEISNFIVMDYVKPTAFIKEVRLNGVKLNSTEPPTHHQDGTPNIEGLKVANDLMLSYSEPLKNFKPYGDYMTMPSLYVNEVYTEILKEATKDSNNEALNEVIGLLALNLDKCKLDKDETKETKFFTSLLFLIKDEPKLKDYGEITDLEKMLKNGYEG